MSGDSIGDITVSGSPAAVVGSRNVRVRYSSGPGAPSARERESPEGLMDQRPRNVFVVYGRDTEATGAVFRLLRSLDLRPLEWEMLVHAAGEASPFLGNVVAGAPKLAQAAVVILTPDDNVLLHPELRNPPEDPFEMRPALQPRPNVLVELGLALAVYPQSTIILEFGVMRPFADIGGRNVIRFNEAVPVPEALKKIAGRLKMAGCPVDDSGTDWLDPRPFTGLRAYHRKPA